MRTDEAVLDEIDKAFGPVRRPAQFHPDLSDPEAKEHDDLLRTRDRDTLTLADVGNAGWDPICDALPAAIAYFFPKLARLALATTQNPFDWYANQLLFHLTYKKNNNAFYQYCNSQQKAAVTVFLKHIIETRAMLLRECGSADEFARSLTLWQ